MGISVRTDSGILEGKSRRVVEEILEDATDTVSQEGFKMVRAKLGAVLKHPTGYYESHITVSNMGDGATISDGGVVYGPWLEGTSSRNGSTRFKGYHTFRKVLQDLEHSAEPLLDKAVGKNIRRL